MEEWERERKVAWKIVEYIQRHDIIEFADLIDFIMAMSPIDEAMEWFEICTGKPEFFVEYLKSRRGMNWAHYVSRPTE